MSRIRAFTIGHSTRPIDEFLAILRSHRVEVVADVRTVPRSRRNPQYDQDGLRRALAAAGIDYVHLAALGGFRHPAAESPNAGWRSIAFRGFADYMLTREFEEALAVLIGLARRRRIAVMCAEAVPWRCHRSLIADALAVRGVEVVEIVGVGKDRPHPITAWARVAGTRITYPPAPDDFPRTVPGSPNDGQEAPGPR